MSSYGKSTMAIAAAFALFLGIPPAMQAQTGGQGTQGQGSQAPQVDPDSEEFERFADAFAEVEQIQEEVNQEVQQLISDSPLNEERFQAIHQQMQGAGGQQGSDGQSSGSDVSEQEQTQYENLLSEIQSTQQSFQEEMISEVESSDLTVQRFNQIMVAIQNNPDLREELDQLQGEG